MKIAVIGAGPSGLVTAAVLRDVGHEVVVFEKAPDVGGVWSAGRRYPGVTTQDDRVSYAFSDLPMAPGVAEHPTGEQVQGYLQDYARHKDLTAHLRLSTEVVSVTRDEPTGGWVLDVVPTGPGRRTERREHADWVVLANGVFSTPHVPDWPGRAEFEAAGGRVAPPTGLGEGAVLRDRSVLVVGWGKTACDVAVAGVGLGARTTLVARAVRWKVPRRIVAGLTFRHLLLTRAGEHVLAPERSTRTQRAVATLDAPLRRGVIGLLGAAIARGTRLRPLGLLPSGPLPHADSLVSEGFLDAVTTGRLTVRREVSVQSLGALDGVPGARLSDGSWVPAQVVVPATGFEQDISVLDPATRAALCDADDVMSLHRRIVPADVAQLAFAGWGNTYRSPLTAEVGAVWLAAHLAGQIPLPPREQLLAEADRYPLTHSRAAALGMPQLPSGSFAALDTLLGDLRLPLPALTRLRQWVVPLTPATYAYLLPRLQQRLGRIPRQGGPSRARSASDRAGARTPVVTR